MLKLFRESPKVTAVCGNEVLFFTGSRDFDLSSVNPVSFCLCSLLFHYCFSGLVAIFAESAEFRLFFVVNAVTLRL
jgi:hypothetical protein